MIETQKTAQWAKAGTDELDKRFYVDGVIIKSNCPECGKEIERDLSDHYLSYPHVGINEFGFCHEGENGDYHEWSVDVELIIGVRVVDKNPE